MSWLSDNLFGISKSKETPTEGMASPTVNTSVPSTDEIQNGTITTSQNGTASNAVTNEDTGAEYETREVAAEWHVPIRGKLHKIEFEHGTTSGRRILWINEKEIFRRDWMFKLVGDDIFELDDLRCILRVDPAPGFKYKYSLFVDGKPLDQYKQRQAKGLRIWEATINEIQYRVVLEKDTLNIYLNGTVREEEGEFTDSGTETKWEEDGNVFILNARNSGNKHDGLLHKLTINGAEIQETTE
ncbi:fas apoptotic inhibitory molecule 1 [Contarinia nasturtii]|uniref:fas apoptotic inhibitory molecule 1 n=1 Tax=Contarinia nasturtii TaxID=265458 RepID=UPI0012D477C0|nr:fas apoptotic inhibitory molecule 1 [Contarinia nasturtii]XP_031636195.1 fas apoptotic inhibitory molecule 1 [Contarinia nasturtii]XP_031636205.1 fas apoptotic inhibitory molecule 1 [Contarinia nasturtii]